MIGRGDQVGGGVALRSEPESDVSDERDHGGDGDVRGHEEHGPECPALSPAAGDEAFQHCQVAAAGLFRSRWRTRHYVCIGTRAATNATAPAAPPTVIIPTTA